MPETTFRFEGDPFVPYQGTSPTPEPLPVGVSRTHTIRFDEVQPEQAGDRLRRKLIVCAFGEILNTCWFVPWLIVAFPRHLRADYGIPTLVGVPMAIPLAFAAIAATFYVVNHIWPR